MRLLEGLIRDCDIVWDVGAHQGYVTLLASRRVGPAGMVYAFEPCRANREILQRHVRWNRLANVHVLPFALGAVDGEASLGGGETSRMHALGRGDERVAVRTAASLVGSGIPTPTFLKMDVEGAEADALAGAMSVLRPDARLLIAMHSATVYRACLEVLRRAQFAVIESRGLAACRVGPWHGDPDAYCHGPVNGAAAADHRLLRTSGL